MTNSEYNDSNNTSPSLSLQITEDNDNDSDKDDSDGNGNIIVKKTVDGKIITTNNNMNSRINKQLNQLPENLRLNGRTPSGKPRLFVCQICTRAFARQEHLTRHERSHTKEKPYCCGICNRKFSRRDLLLRHAHKIHGGNYGDTIIKSNVSSSSSGSSKVIKRRQSSTISPPCIGANARRARLTTKRRASYSAQSGNYVAPSKNEENHRVDRVKFSTPELLPVDFKCYVGKEEGEDEEGQNADDEGNHNEDDDTNMLFSELPNINLNTPNEFNLLDTVNWINDYNENGVSSCTGTAKTRASSADVSPPSNNSNDQRLLNNNKIDSVRNSSWSINEGSGGLQIKSLFRNKKSPSVSSSDNISTANTNGKNDWFQVSSTLSGGAPPVSALANVYDNRNNLADLKNSPLNDNTPNSNTNSNSSAISEKLSNLQFEDEIGNLTNFTKDVQSVFGRFIQDEETQLYSTQDYHFDNNGIDTTIDTKLQTATTHDHFNSHMNRDNYTFYGLDYLSLTNISRASPPDVSGSDHLPPSKLFTSELRQMCIHALKYYNTNCNSSGGSSSGGDPVLISKDLVVPSCNELNCYLSYFQEYFNSHSSSVHPDLFNLDLQSLRRYVNEDEVGDEGNDASLQYSNLACLPLFMATVGSLYKPGCNSKTMELYEISRRVLHVYLESRKKQKQQLRSPAKPGQHVWLIQSLTLSIIFAIFADYLERIDSEMIKRQVSAVCSIIKNNFLNVISIDSDELTPTITTQSPVTATSLPHNYNFDSSFDYIMFESKIRCTLIVYKFCQFLKTFNHVNSKLFLNERDLEGICIPDDEQNWHAASLLLPYSPMIKKYTTNFQKFYNSFTFNNAGMHPIPESLASIMLYYEFNASTSSTFHVFLTRIDTKKLKMNLPPSQSQSNFENDTQINYTSVLNNDSIILRNCLMSMVFFNKIDIEFGAKVWNGQLKELSDSFLNSKYLNILNKGSYSLLTDFLVALNFSIKNIANLLKLNDSFTSIELDKTCLSMFNLQAYYYDFMTLIKFIMDFEVTPNFKLLCIFTELKKLANNLLIPKFSNLYPSEFTKFKDISMTNNFIRQNSLSDLTPHYSSINVNRLEKLINNVLVYSFNDASFLNMTDQPTNEFLFNKSYPTYHPYLSSAETSMPTSSSSAASGQPQSSRQTPVGFTESVMSQHNNTQDNDEPMPTKSSVDLLSCYDNARSSKQGFAERYQLSDKYIVIAKCFFMHIRETYAHCHILEKMANDFREFEKYLDNERHHSSISKSLNEESHPNNMMILKSSANGNKVVIENNNSSGDLLNKFLQSQM